MASLLVQLLILLRRPAEWMQSLRYYLMLLWHSATWTRSSRYYWILLRGASVSQNVTTFSDTDVTISFSCFIGVWGCALLLSCGKSIMVSYCNISLYDFDRRAASIYEFNSSSLNLVCGISSFSPVLSSHWMSFLISILILSKSLYLADRTVVQSHVSWHFHVT